MLVNTWYDKISTTNAYKVIDNSYWLGQSPTRPHIYLLAWIFVTAVWLHCHNVAIATLNNIVIVWEGDWHRDVLRLTLSRASVGSGCNGMLCLLLA